MNGCGGVTSGAGAQEGKVAVVAGASGAVARGLADAGARVVLMDVAADAIRTLTGEIGNGAREIAVDLGTPAEVREAAAAVAALGGADILVNNAGILSNNKMEGTDLAEWRQVLAVNLDAAFLFTPALLPEMRVRRWGRIVNIASYAAKCGGLTAGTAYTVSNCPATAGGGDSRPCALSHHQYHPAAGILYPGDQHLPSLSDGSMT